MTTSVFPQIQFWLLVVFSFVLPLAMYVTLFAKRAISRRTVFALGLSLVVIAGIDVYLLQILATLARATSSLADDRIFNSELSVALYILPALFAGTGINLVSHALIHHLTKAQARFDRDHPGG